MSRKSVNPERLFNTTQFGFSQITISDKRRQVFISGQVAWNEKMEIVGKDNLQLQAQKAIDNLKLALEEIGGSLDDIMMLRIYKVDYKSEDGPIISGVLKNNFGTENPPASTWINVQGLANEDFMIEIEAQAIIE